MGLFKFACDWKTIVTKAWSFRFLAVAAVFSTAEAIVPLFSNNFPTPVFSVITFVAVIGALISRILAQTNYPVAQVVVVRSTDTDTDGTSTD